MARYALAILILFGTALPALATTNFIYPTPAWKISTEQGEDIGGGLYHMGVDVGYNMTAGTPIYAVADGIVREAKERSQFGLVVLIEHFPDDSSPNVSLSGHLDPTQILVSPGQRVSAGDLIGVLGSEANNGGWTPHLHFGIHKQAYTGEWVYYGHVHDPETANDWYDPVTYIPDHLIADDWAPTISLDIEEGDIVGNTIELTGTVGDIGSGVSKVRIKASSNGIDYDTISVNEDPNYSLDQYLNISSYADGDLYLSVVARDQFNHKTIVTRRVTKDPYRYTTPAFVAMKGGNSDAFVTQWSFGGTALNAFFPFKDSWNKGGLLAAGDVYDGDQTEIISLRLPKKNTSPFIKVMSASGDVRQKFSLPGITPTALTVGNETIYVAQPLTGYDDAGTVTWSSGALNLDRTVTDLAVDSTTLYVCWQADGKSRLSLIDLTTTELIKTVRPLRKTATTGCQVAVGDFTGDGTDELTIGSNGDTAGTVRLLTKRGRGLNDSFRPFGDDFKGIVDVSAGQWDTLEDGLTEMELLVSQASAGQAWVKVYRLSNGTEISATERVYEEEFNKGTLIVAWP